jgi:hypothetical protein
MLSSVGIHGALLMVDTERGVIDPDAPSIMGNHMIGAIEIPKGYESPKLHSVVTAKTGKRYLIFDPTWDLTPFGQLENNLQGGYGVLMEGANSQVIQLPLMDPKLNTIRRTASFQLRADGSLKGSVTDKRFGDLAERRRYVFAHDDAKKQQEYMDHAVAHDLTAASLTGAEGVECGRAEPGPDHDLRPGGNSFRHFDRASAHGASQGAGQLHAGCGPQIPQGADRSRRDHAGHRRIRHRAA